jgi:hypothetical protein
MGLTSGEFERDGQSIGIDKGMDPRIREGKPLSSARPANGPCNRIDRLFFGVASMLMHADRG